MRWLLLLVALAGCGYKGRVKNLSDAEFNHYYALRPFMDEGQIKTYLKMKTEAERSDYLKKLGLWDRFYQYPERVRQQIVDGDVAVGWKKDQVLMSWGQPYDLRKPPGRAAERSEMYVYRFEQQADGTVLVWAPGSKTYRTAVRLFVREVILDNDTVAEINRKDANW